MKQTEYEEFKGQLKKALEDAAGEGCSVAFDMVTKLNGEQKEVLLLSTMEDQGRLRSQNPVREYFKDYRSGTCGMDELVRHILLGHRKADRNIMPELPNLFRDYGKVKDRIFFRAINAERNKELLRDVLHEEVLDLALVFCILVRQTGQEMQSCMIRNHMAEQWGIDPSVAMEDGKKNTGILFPAVKYTMETMVREILERRGMEDAERECFESVPTGSGPLSYILTTGTGINGFQAVFYPDSLRGIAEEWESDLYILPSSIHEAVILPAGQDGKEIDRLSGMVAEVNRECVLPEEYLSDSVYYVVRQIRWWFIRHIIWWRFLTWHTRISNYLMLFRHFIWIQSPLRQII